MERLDLEKKGSSLEEWKLRFIKEKRNIVLWGTGKKAIRAVSVLKIQEGNPFHIRFVLDNLHSVREFYGLSVRHPEDIRNWEEYFVIVAVNNGYAQIAEQLNLYGLASGSDFIHWEEMDSKIILGISALYHDSAAALVIDGEIIAAAQEERFTRIKHDHRFPENAIRYCMKEAAIAYEDLDAVVYYDNPILSLDRLLHNIRAAGKADKDLVNRNLRNFLIDKAWIHQKVARISKNKVPKKKVFVTEHHISHAASAFFASPFEEAAVLVFDGVGEWATSTIGIGRGNRMRILKQMDYPHSLGLLYSAFTFFCGFRVNSGEYKLMGLAPYGRPVYYDVIKQNLVTIYEDGSYRLNLQYFDFYLGGNMTSKKFEELFGGEARKPEGAITRREMDLAASIQKITEEIVIKAAAYAKRITELPNLCLAGGVALNCVANGELLRQRIFDEIWIQPAAGDAGGALGAALYFYYHYLDRLRRVDDGDSMKGSYLGPSYNQAEVMEFLESNGYRYHDYNEVPKLMHQKIAEYLEKDKVIGLFQGRMEYGPRALGNRSIIANPKSKEMQSKLNLKIKFRESFRPFAPSVLAEKCQDYFELNAESPYMLFVATVKHSLRESGNEENEKQMDLIERVNQCRSAIPAVTHVDYSARIQTVSEKMNPEYHKIIKEFEKRTGCSCIVNTSFNVRGEPIVCTLQDAYLCFMRTEMDILILGKCILLKEEQEKIEMDDWRKEYELD